MRKYWNKIKNAQDRAEYLMKTQREAEKRFVERLESQTLSDQFQALRWRKTQVLRKSWDGEKGKGKQMLQSMNDLSAEAVRETLRVNGYAMIF